MVRSFLVAIILAVITLSAAPTLYCQDDNSAPVLSTIDGRVVSVDPQNSKIVIKTVEDLDFTVLSNATITNEDGFDMRLSDVKEGSYAMVGYYKDKSGRRMASNISVEYRDQSDDGWKSVF